MASDRLKKLHTTLVDNRKGYEEAVRDADDPGMKALFGEMISLKERNHSDLHGALARLGEHPDETESFMATVHTTVISVRAAVTGLGRNALSSFVMGEEQVVDEYDKALDECASDPAIVATLTRQKEALLRKIAEMKRLAT